MTRLAQVKAELAAVRAELGQTQLALYDHVSKGRGFLHASRRFKVEGTVYHVYYHARALPLLTVDATPGTVDVAEFDAYVRHVYGWAPSPTKTRMLQELMELAHVAAFIRAPRTDVGCVREGSDAE